MDSLLLKILVVEFLPTFKKVQKEFQIAQLCHCNIYKT